MRPWGRWLTQDGAGVPHGAAGRSCTKQSLRWLAFPKPFLTEEGREVVRRQRVAEDVDRKLRFGGKLVLGCADAAGTFAPQAPASGRSKLTSCMPPPHHHSV